MADGTAVDPIVVVDDEDKVTLGLRLSWFVKKREGLLTLWIIAASALLVFVLLLHSFTQPILESSEAKIGFLIASTMLFLPLLLLLLDPDDNFTKGPRLRLPLAAVCILVVLASLAGLSKTLELGWFGRDSLEGLKSQEALALLAFFSFLIVALVPLIWNSRNFSKYEVSRLTSKSAKQGADFPQDSEKDAEAMGALIATVVVLAIGTLAWVAGENGSSLQFANLFGFILCMSVIGVFAIVVFLDVISESSFVKAISRAFQWIAKRMHWLAAIYNFIDSGLVRLGASVAGMNHRSVYSRYFLLISLLTSLIVMGWFLPAPLGLIPLGLAFVLAISVSRLWGWVEEDRALAAMTDYSPQAPYKIGFREDFRDETLLGFIFVFLIVPVAMMQAHSGEMFGGSLFKNTENKGFVNWLGFFGVELAKAVPIVDWAEIYQIGPSDNLISMDDKNTASKHSVFLARVMVDLVLIAALVQAIGIANRNRQQKRLFNASHIDRLDHFVERRELHKSIHHTLLISSAEVPKQASKLEASACFDIAKLSDLQVLDFRKYNKKRIFHLYVTEKSNLVRAFLAALAEEEKIPLSHAIDVTLEIAESDKDEYELIRSFDRAVSEHEDGSNPLELGDLYRILSALRVNSGFKDFKARVMRQMMEVGQPSEAIDYLSGIAVGETADKFQYARDEAAETIVKLAELTDDKQAIASAIDRMAAKSSLLDYLMPKAAVQRKSIRLLSRRLEVLGGVQ